MARALTSIYGIGEMINQYTFKIYIGNMTTNEIAKTIQGKRSCLNCKFLYLYIIDGKLIAACRYFEPAQRLRKFGYCGWWERRIIDLHLTNRLKRKHQIRLYSDFRDTKGRGEDCNTCANAISRRPFIGCELKVKDFTLEDEVICCRCYVKVE